ncbi:sugar ABC transporter substrate-binding protein [Amycolatopsis taiwanensis]|uniref:Extracellular solute-binding protein n=1 Tax=Amycolatopsis taiwanensis TaxID=342230 RepID=A0A9W6VIV3_9PSEU|nr:extracellular solute-binding protein [Amycolatopsis taiwanensis]GLY68844.1 hypothetical protein Atai01_54630 [Amycolatopsis taiwanensis]
MGFVAAFSLFNDVGTAASTIVGICGAITAVGALARAAGASRRRARARALKISWQVGSRAEQTGALALNESKTTFENVVLTVACGIHGREVRQDLGLLRAGQDYLWASTVVHESLRSRKVDHGLDQGNGASHDRRPHGVQVTFRNGRRYWFRDDKRVERVKSLVIWAEQTRAKTLARYFGQWSPFHRSYPVSVKVQPFERTEALEHAFMRLAETGDPPRGHEVPDVVVGPHDWIGRVARDESVVEPPLNPKWVRPISPSALEALSRNDRLYAIPYVFDSVALIRNNALTGPGPMPTSLAEAVAAGEKALEAKGIEDGSALALQVGAPDAHGNAGDPFHMWPLFASLGGSFFGFRGQESGAGSFDDISRWRESFVDAFVRLAELGCAPDGKGVLRPTLGRAEALELFLSGRAPFFVCSSRGLAAIRDRKLDVTVGVVPPAGDQPAQPMVSVYGMYIYRDAPNLPAARDLLTSYVSQPRAGLDLNRFQQLVPVQDEAMSKIGERDPVLRPYVEQCRRGLHMPSWPEMREAWQLVGRAQYEVLAGDGGDPRELAAVTAERGWELLRQARGA